MEIIYRTSDLFIVGTITTNMNTQQELIKNVLPNFGGKEEDYATLNVPYNSFELEMVDGKVVAVETEPPQPEPLPPTKEDLMGMELTKLKLEIIQLKGGI